MTMSSSTPPTSASGHIHSLGAGARRKLLLAGAIGNLVEFYDWGLYSVFATTIAALYFPQTDPTAALLSTFAIFALGYVARPIGGLVFGHFGDRLGRRKVLLTTVLLMSSATAAMGLLPTYAQIGVMAPILLVVCRLLQGFSAGGEATASTVFLVEHAPYNRRGSYATMTPGIANIGVVFGAVAGLIMTSTTTPTQLAEWGWRVPFLVAAPLALVGLYLRRQTEESPVFAAVRAEGGLESAPVVKVLKSAKKSMLIVIALMMTYAVGSNIGFSFLLPYLTETLKFGKTDSLVVYIVVMLAGALGSFLAGPLIDIAGLKRIAIVFTLAVVIWAVPPFVLLQGSTVPEACLIVGLLALLVGGAGTTSFLALVEIFPARVRSSASALAYQLTIAVFSGTTALVGTWLIREAHLPLGPGYYLAAIGLISTIVAVAGIGKGSKAYRGLEVAPAANESSVQAGAASE